jgi:hypothetical protein
MVIESTVLPDYNVDPVGWLVLVNTAAGSTQSGFVVNDAGTDIIVGSNQDAADISITPPAIAFPFTYPVTLTIERSDGMITTSAVDATNTVFDLGTNAATDASAYDPRIVFLDFGASPPGSSMTVSLIEFSGDNVPDVNQGGGGGGGGEGVIITHDFEGADHAEAVLDGCCGGNQGLLPRSVASGGTGAVTSGDVPPGGGTASGFLTRPGTGSGGDSSFAGFSIDFRNNEGGEGIDATAARFFNFYLKFDSTDVGAVSYNMELRDQSATSETDPPRVAISGLGDFTALPGFVNNDWFYVSLALPQGASARGDIPAQGTWVENFGRVTNAWFFGTNAVGTDDLVLHIDHVTFTVTSEQGMLGGGGGGGETEQDASVSYRAVAGDSVCYDVTNPGTAGPGDFTWTFDDGTGAVTLEGEEDGQLCFEPLTEADAGTYVASFDDGDPAKVPNTFTLVLDVLPEGTAVPASTNWTLFITMLALLLSGAALMYGRKKGLSAKD